MKKKVVTFHGERFLVEDLTNSPIATKEQMENGECSFAHLFPNGDILRFGKVIGKREDLLDTGETEEVEMGLSALLGILSDPSWSET